MTEMNSSSTLVHGIACSIRLRLRCRDLAFLGMNSILIDSKSFEGVDYLPVCHDLQIMRGKEILHHSWTKTDVTL